MYVFHYTKCKKKTFSIFFYGYVTCYDLNIVISGTLGLLITNIMLSGYFSNNDPFRYQPILINCKDYH
jgi:hypothetical protein